MPHSLGGSVGRAALAPGAGVLADGNAVVQLAVVPLVAGLRPVGVEGVGNVGGQAEGIGEAVGQLDALGIAQALHEMFKVVALHTGNTHRANLFLVGKDADGGLFGHVQREQGFQLGVGADPVVVAVGAEQAAVKTRLPAASRGNHRQLGGEEVALHKAVLLVQQLHDVQLHEVRAVALQRLGTEDHVQLLALDDLPRRLLHLIRRQMGQQVGDHQDGVALILADGNRDHSAVRPVHHAVERQRNSRPLVFLDAAVIVGLQVADLGILVQGVGLDVQSGGIHVGGADVRALAQRLGTDNGQSDGFIAVVVVNFVAGLGFHAGGEGLVAQLLGFPNGPCGGLPLGLAFAHERHVALSIAFHFIPLAVGEPGVAVLGRRQQGIAQFFCGHVASSYVSFRLRHQAGRYVGVGQIFRQRRKQSDFPDLAFRQGFQTANRREKHHAVGAALGIEAAVVADRVKLRVPDAAFLIQLPSGSLHGRFSRLDVAALGFPCVPLPVAAEKPLPVVPGADDNEGICPQCPRRVDGALQRLAALARCVHYTNSPQKRKAFFPEFRR